MQKLNFTFHVLSFILLSSCQKENQFDCLKSTGKMSSEERTIPAYTGIDVNDNVNVFITQSELQELKVEAGENLLENIITEVKDGILYIENINKCNWIRSYKPEVNVYLSTNTLKNIRFRGFGKLKSLNKYSSKGFYVDMWEASGDLELDLECDTVFLKSHTGSANIECSGSTEVLVLYMSGTGIIDASKLQSSYALVINRDVGDLHVNVNWMMDAEIYSRGDIFYYGDPVHINLLKEGEGKLIQKN